jgi:ubiquinone/menaquinone biosynthesis C-methylase UbiE
MNFWSKGTAAIAKALRLDLTHSYLHYAKALSPLVSEGDRWLELGCGRQILAPWVLNPDAQIALASRASLLVGMDFDASILEHPLLQARVIGKGEELPFAAETFDLVTANMVFEHVQDPAQVLAEVRRVLNPGGRLLVHTPNYLSYMVLLASLVPDAIKRRVVWILEHRREEDIFPTLYRFNTVRRIRKLAAASGFEVESLRPNVSSCWFTAFGPVAWIECLWLKLLSVVGRGTLDAGLVVVLRRPVARERVAAPKKTVAGEIAA